MVTLTTAIILYLTTLMTILTNMPRKKMPKEVEQEVVRLRLSGYTRDEIAEKLGISGGKVSMVLSGFENVSERDGLDVAARNYDVEMDVRSLVNLAIQLRKSGVTVAESSAGARIMGKLRDLGVKEEDLERFVAKIYRGSKELGLAPESLVEAASELFRLREETGLEYHEVIAKYRAASEEKAKLEDEIRKLKKEKEDALREKEATIELLNEYVKLRDSLKGYGLDVKDLPRLRDLLKNAGEMDYEAKAVVEELSKVESLTERKGELEKEVKELEDRASSLSRKAEEAESSVKEKEPIIKQAKTLEGLGFDATKLETLSQTIKEIMVQHGYKPKEAVEKFFKDLEDYDGKLGFEQELKKLQTEIGETKTELSRQQTELEALKAKHADLSSAINSIQELRRKKVSPEHIISWNKIVAQSGCQPSELQELLEEYGGIQNLTSSKRNALKELEDSLNRRRAELEELERKKSSVEASMKAIESTCIKEIEDLKGEAASELRSLDSEARSRVKGLLEEVDSSFTNRLNQLTDGALSRIQKASGEAEGRLSQTYSNIEKTLKNAQAAFEGYSKKLDELLEESIEAGKRLGKLKALEPLLNLLERGEGEPSRVHPVLLQVMESYRDWMDKQQPEECKSLKEYVETLIKFIRTDIRHGWV
jgi:DNA repair exonuclease SbcCD ATPase subunit